MADAATIEEATTGSDPNFPTIPVWEEDLKRLSVFQLLMTPEHLKAFHDAVSDIVKDAGIRRGTAAQIATIFHGAYQNWFPMTSYDDDVIGLKPDEREIIWYIIANVTWTHTVLVRTILHRICEYINVHLRTRGTSSLDEKSKNSWKAFARVLLRASLYSHRRMHIFASRVDLVSELYPESERVGYLMKLLGETELFNESTSLPPGIEMLLMEMVDLLSTPSVRDALMPSLEQLVVGDNDGGRISTDTGSKRLIHLLMRFIDYYSTWSKVSQLMPSLTGTPLGDTLFPMTNNTSFDSIPELESLMRAGLDIVGPAFSKYFHVTIHRQVATAFVDSSTYRLAQQLLFGLHPSRHRASELMEVVTRKLHASINKQVTSPQPAPGVIALGSAVMQLGINGKTVETSLENPNGAQMAIWADPGLCIRLSDKERGPEIYQELTKASMHSDHNALFQTNRDLLDVSESHLDDLWTVFEVAFGTDDLSNHRRLDEAISNILNDPRMSTVYDYGQKAQENDDRLHRLFLRNDDTLLALAKHGLFPYGDEDMQLLNTEITQVLVPDKQVLKRRRPVDPSKKRKEGESTPGEQARFAGEPLGVISLTPSPTYTEYVELRKACFEATTKRIEQVLKAAKELGISINEDTSKWFPDTANVDEPPQVKFLKMFLNPKELMKEVLEEIPIKKFLESITKETGLVADPGAPFKTVYLNGATPKSNEQWGHMYVLASVMQVIVRFFVWMSMDIRSDWIRAQIIERQTNGLPKLLFKEVLRHELDREDDALASATLLAVQAKRKIEQYVLEYKRRWARLFPVRRMNHLMQFPEGQHLVQLYASLGIEIVHDAVEAGFALVSALGNLTIPDISQFPMHSPSFDSGSVLVWLNTKASEWTETLNPFSQIANNAEAVKTIVNDANANLLDNKLKDLLVGEKDMTSDEKTNPLASLISNINLLSHLNKTQTAPSLTDLLGTLREKITTDLTNFNATINSLSSDKKVANIATYVKTMCKEASALVKSAKGIIGDLNTAGATVLSWTDGLAGSWNQHIPITGTTVATVDQATMAVSAASHTLNTVGARPSGFGKGFGSLVATAAFQCAFMSLCPSQPKLMTLLAGAATAGLTTVFHLAEAYRNDKHVLAKDGSLGITRTTIDTATFLESPRTTRGMQILDLMMPNDAPVAQRIINAGVRSSLFKYSTTWGFKRTLAWLQPDGNVTIALLLNGWTWFAVILGLLAILLILVFMPHVDRLVEATCHGVMNVISKGNRLLKGLPLKDKDVKTLEDEALDTIVPTPPGQ